jgi:hypothetical protein
MEGLINKEGVNFMAVLGINSDLRDGKITKLKRLELNLNLGIKEQLKEKDEND